MSLSDHQWIFLQHFGMLIAKAKELGYKLTPGEIRRTPVQAWLNSLPANCTLTALTDDGKEMHYWETVGGLGVAKSLHLSGLAADLNLIKADGTLALAADDYRVLGEYWKSLDPLNRWGGDFIHPRPDPDHFERDVL